MLLGFISLLITVGTSLVSKICILSKAGNIMLPCKQQNSNNKLSHASIKLFAGDTAIRRRVLAPASGANAGQDYCSQYGKVSLISQSGVHQLHIFIFVLAIFHVLYSVITMALAQAKTLQGLGSLIRHPLLGSTVASPQCPGLRWVVAFFRQFFASVTKVDYLTM